MIAMSKIDFSRLSSDEIKNLARMSILIYYDREGYAAAVELLAELIKEA